MQLHQLSTMFNPRSIAVIGANDSDESVGGRVLRNLIEAGYQGDIFAVNPSHETIQGQPCLPSLRALEKSVDLAVIASPPDTVTSILKDCGAASVRNAVVVTAGFSKSGKDSRDAERRLLEIARRSNVRFIGPNCAALVRPWIGLNASSLKSETPPGKLAVISQSGALVSAISDWAASNYLGFSALISLGSSVDSRFGDALSYLATDPKTDAILLYVEGIRNARSFISELRAAARTKPIVVLKGGRHRKSSTAANTHTGGLVGSNEVFDAALERAGAIRANTFGQLFAAAEMLSAHKRANGNRLCIITDAGGAGVIAADRAEDLGIALPSPSDATMETLNKLLPENWSRANPIDILGAATPELFSETATACLSDSSYQGVLVILTPQSQTDADLTAKKIAEASKTNRRKPLIACWMGGTTVSGGREHLANAGIPEFATPERAVEAFSYLARHELNQRLSLETPGPDVLSGRQDIVGANMIIDSALSEGRKMLSDIESKAILRAFGINVGTALEASTASKALIAAETLGFPVAMKINSPEITHKSDIGGVKINLMSAPDIRPAFNELIEKAKAAAPDARILGVTIESMAKVEDSRELLVGVTRDPVFGPTIVFGAGGTMVEVLKDSAVALPPLNTVLAERLIDRTRVSGLLSAFRNRPAVDRDAVVEVLLRVSDMIAELPQIRELDINPLIAGPDGVLAVDARIEIGRAPSMSAPYDHMAIAPYPTHLVETGFMSDGEPITIRPIRPEDAESEREFVRSLSAETKHFRFMQTIHELTPQMVAQFTQIDYSREMALIALTQENGEDEQVAVARYVINPDGRTCEFAIVVGDEVHSRGIGSRLMRALINSTRLHGLTTMEGLVLADNRSMLALMRTLGFSDRPDEDDPDLVVVERRI